MNTHTIEQANESLAKNAEIQVLQARVRELENVLDVLHGIASVTLAHPPEIDTKVWIEIATIIEKMKGPHDER